MTAQVATRQSRAIVRPLKVLIPMIQGELQMGNDAGREHYTNAGTLLIEAKDQVPHGSWGTWLSKNFDMHRSTAAGYMRWARTQNEGGAAHFSSMRQMTGHSERQREERRSKQHQEFKKVMRDMARDEYVQQRQSLDTEIKLHRDLAEELVDAGYRALATRLHPDRGGSKDAMTRLNRVRDELKQYAQTRRFI
jgi:hypothetical protein